MSLLTAPTPGYSGPIVAHICRQDGAVHAHPVALCDTCSKLPGPHQEFTIVGLVNQINAMIRR